MITLRGWWSRVLLDFVKENCNANPFTITLDRLDDGWDASDESKMLLAGVLKAARDFNQTLSRSGQPAPILTFLRSDIFNELRFNDKNKIVADIEFLDWTEEKLIDVASARIARSLKCSRQSAWSRVFSSIEMRQRASIQSYILKRTMWRPRDIIACVRLRVGPFSMGAVKISPRALKRARSPFGLSPTDSILFAAEMRLGRLAKPSLGTLIEMGVLRWLLRSSTCSSPLSS